MSVGNDCRVFWGGGGCGCRRHDLEIVVVEVGISHGSADVHGF